MGSSGTGLFGGQAMLVSHANQFIYTKTVKTASTSVEVYFEKYCVPAGAGSPQHWRSEYSGPEGIVGYRGPDSGQSTWVNHMSAAAIRDRVGRDMWDRYFKFCVVRNPFDLLVSYYWFKQRSDEPKNHYAQDPINGFRSWLANGDPVLGRTQYMIDGRFCLDYFVRYESLMADLEAVCVRLGILFEPATIPRLKAGIRDHEISLEEYYTSELAERVATAYAPEVRKFGYKTPSLAQFSVQ